MLTTIISRDLEYLNHRAHPAMNEPVTICIDARTRGARTITLP